jgi:lysine 2,3-aminomutase
VWLNTHFNHPHEITAESSEACARLADAGVPLGNQSVLLRGVNDCPQVMRNLLQQLVRQRVRPFYLYQCDLAPGLEHFRTPVSRGLEIMETLRGHTSGLAVPTYVIDAPGGGGKIPILPQYLISQSDKKVILRNYEGVICAYNEPADRTSRCDTCDNEECARNNGGQLVGMEKLFAGRKINLVPQNMVREERRRDYDRNQAGQVGK